MTLPRPLLSLVLVLLLQSLTTSAAYTPGPGHDLFARQNPNCVRDCQVPPCVCASNQYCALTVQTCDACPKATCTDVQGSDSGGDDDDGGSSSPSVGPIVGGVFGGLAAAGIIGFLLYRTFIRKKKQERVSMAATAAEKENDFGMLKSARASTHTVASIASTVRTRASNVIQIAYIPGVTNRSGPSTPSHLAPPPVPPLPGSPATSQYPRSPLAGDLQFSADDILRGSMYTVNDNRSSVATTIYGQNAVVSQPNIIRAGKAAVVTVKGGSSLATSIASSPSSTVPPVPALYLNGKGKQRQSTLEKVPSSPAFSVGSTFLNRMNSVKQPKTDLPSGAIGENHSTTSFIYDSSDSDDADIGPGQRIKRPQSACSSCITDMDTTSPFSDTNSVAVDDIPGPSNSGQPLAGNARRQSQSLAQPQLRTLDVRVVSTQRTVSPFDDSNSMDKQ
ncbi:unnamed protein product [Tuber aestivum]|uniref:Uncharacterized protein n=1 Tax=Tuber aestivum TaxID=59557 RepID=A0A292PP09_9PEZI|nr:unnamed protein product [Tuber aestivum]